MVQPSAPASAASWLDKMVVGARAQAAIAAGFLLLLLACAAAATFTVRSRTADDLVTHTLEVRRNIQRATSALTEVESSQRGYLLTGDEAYLETLEPARTGLADSLNRLLILTKDNELQQTRLKNIAPIIAQRLAIVDRSVLLKRESRGGEATLVVRRGIGHALSEQARAILKEADAEETALFASRVVAAERQRTGLLAIMLISALLAMILMGAVTLAGRRYTSAVLSANEALKAEIVVRERTQAQLRQSQKMEAVGRLTGGIAHDFNNMLAIVIGSLDLALTRSGDEARVRKHIQNALEGARRGAALTHRLLAFSRQQPLEPKPTDINKSVSDISQLLFRTLGEGVHIETVLAAGLWRANIDAPQLESALLNLAVNARDAMPNGGKLSIETSNTYLDQTYSGAHEEVIAGQYLMLAVTDTGAGMTAEVMANAFEPFFTTKPPGAGTGLGLSQVHGFVKQSGGHVKLYSEPGQGTTVKLYFPRHTADAPSTGATLPDRPERSDLAFTVLVVEDEAGVRAFVTEALQELGHSVLEAENANVALTLLARHPEIDLLLTDVVMPEMNGRQLVERAHAERPDLAVLYMTGYTRNAIVHNGVLDAGTNLLTKPFTLNQLESELREVLPPAPRK